MLKKLICFLKTRHKNRKLNGAPFQKQVDLNQYIWFKPYKCADCQYEGKERL